MKMVFLYLMALLYVSAGINHFVNPAFYENIMPAWLPWHSFLNYLSGLAEIILAILLLHVKTRRISAILIIAMLIVFFFVIHIPMAISFYGTNHPGFWLSIIRLPIQILLIWWSWLYTKQTSAK